jgi:hypothetical protein
MVLAYCSDGYLWCRNAAQANWDAHIVDVALPACACGGVPVASISTVKFERSTEQLAETLLR